MRAVPSHYVLILSATKNKLLFINSGLKMLLKAELDVQGVSSPSKMAATGALGLNVWWWYWLGLVAAG